MSGFRTRKEAQKALVGILAQLDSGAYVSSSSETVAEFLRSWLPTLQTRGLRPLTIASYAMIVEKHLIPRLGADPAPAIVCDRPQRVLREHAQRRSR